MATATTNVEWAPDGTATIVTSSRQRMRATYRQPWRVVFLVLLSLFALDRLFAVFIQQVFWIRGLIYSFSWASATFLVLMDVILLLFLLLVATWFIRGHLVESVGSCGITCEMWIGRRRIITMSRAPWSKVKEMRLESEQSPGRVSYRTWMGRLFIGTGLDDPQSAELLGRMSRLQRAARPA